MKKIFLALFTITFLNFLAIGQVTDQRTNNTRIADILALMPAKDSIQFAAAMNDIGAMGVSGLTQMTAMLVAPEAGDNTALEFAINGFSYYVTKNGKEDWRKMSEAAYCKSLETTTHINTKEFLLTQLLIVAREDQTADCLGKYLNEEQLCDPAARALINMGSQAAKSVLMNSLNASGGSCRLSLIKALGHTRYTPALAVISSFATSEDAVLKSVALDALAEIGDPSSELILQQAAESSGFVFDKTNAVASYFKYLNRLAEGGNNVAIKKTAEQHIKNLTGKDQVAARVAALYLLERVSKEQINSVLLNASQDKNKIFRLAALDLAAGNVDDKAVKAWVKRIKRSDPEIQAEIIGLLGDTRQESAMPSMLAALKNKNENVRLSAITAAGKTGNEEALPALLTLMKNGNKAEVDAVKDAISVMQGNSVVDKIAAALPSMPSYAKASLVSVLGNRAAHDKREVVFPLLKSNDTTVRNAAYSSLGTLVNKDDLPVLFSILNTSNSPKEITSLQKAITVAVNNIGDPSREAAMALQQMNAAPGDKKHLYFSILAGIGGKASLQEVESGFNTTDTIVKNAALMALTSWGDSLAANTLFSIAGNNGESNFFNRALQGYIQSINKGQYPDAQKLLMLRKAMDIAKSTDQKRTIIRETGKLRTFNALIFAGHYLNDNALQQAAARSVMTIALSDKDFYGKVVKGLLTKTMEILKGGDSDYEREAIRKFIAEMPSQEGYESVFTGHDLSGWKGLVGNPLKRLKMDEKQLATEQAKADQIMKDGWYAKDGVLHFTGKGDNICTVKQYGDFEMLVDWKITPEGDAGIYLRGSPQVQIWDTSLVKVGAQVGSGGLYNNQKNPSKPLVLADNAIGDWNHFYIKMKGDRVTVYLNGRLVTDSVVLENYWDRNLPIFVKEQIELQAHGTHVAYRDIYIREINNATGFQLSEQEKKEGYTVLFDGSNLDEWSGNLESYVVENGNLVVRPQKGSGGNLYSKNEYGDFVFRFEFQLTPGANNGLGIRTPKEGDAAYVGMELQILDNDADVYKNLKEYQYHGSVYGVIPAKRGSLKPTGEWNYQEVIVQGSKIKVVLNGTVILDGDIAEARKKGTMDKLDHPGIHRNKGHIAFLGHG